MQSTTVLKNEALKVRGIALPREAAYPVSLTALREEPVAEAR